MISFSKWRQLLTKSGFNLPFYSNFTAVLIFLIANVNLGMMPNHA